MKQQWQKIGVAALVAGVCLAAMAFTASATPAQKNLILATTTSTQDSGLLDVLIPIFEKKSGYFVKTIAVGSGQAMAMGQKGEADVLLVHSPAAEKKFIADGFGIDRRIVMHNDFIVVGDPSDPAAIKGVNTTPEAFKFRKPMRTMTLPFPKKEVYSPSILPRTVIFFSRIRPRSSRLISSRGASAKAAINRPSPIRPRRG